MQTSFKFLRQLAKNNDKSWFDENRKVYESAKEETLQFIEKIIKELAKTDASIEALKAKSCMFRINRDVRFSKDKSPYKTNLGASINSNGRKSMSPGYYLHFEPGKSFIGGGMYWADPATTKKIRQEIDYNFEEFQSIVAASNFKKNFTDLHVEEENKLARIPQGYEKENPAAEYLKLKNWIVTKQLSDEEICDPKAVQQIVKSLEAMQPLMQFLGRAIE